MAEKPDYSRQAKYRAKVIAQGLTYRTYAATPEEHKRIKALSDLIKRERSEWGNLTADDKGE